LVGTIAALTKGRWLCLHPRALLNVWRAPMHEEPDFRLFCLALRAPHGRPEQWASCEAADAAVDWAAMVEGASRHRVTGLLLAGLTASGSSHIPAEVLAELQRQTVAAARRSLVQVAEVMRLQVAFAKAGVRILFIKGVVLSAQLFGDAARRDARDIDLLADPHQFAAAASILERLDYRPIEFARSPRQHAEYARRIKDLEFVHAHTGLPVELHHRLTDNPHLLRTDFETLWRERNETRVGETATPTLPRNILPLYLCLHGAGHGWERLCWLVDFAAALREDGSVEGALATAEAEGLEAPMLHALMLAHECLALPVARHLLARARASAAVRRLDRTFAHLYSGGAWHVMPVHGTRAELAHHSLWQRLYRLSLKPDWRYVLAQARREWFSANDWQTLNLPDTLFFLYPVVRPLGWLVRRWRRRDHPVGH
jgi:hypothetical protein